MKSSLAYRSLAFLAFLVLLGPAVAAAQTGQAHAVIVRMLDRNPALRSFRSRVHVDARMYNFPFLRPTLDGTSYFKRPDNYEVVFDRVPAYAKGFERLFNDIGDPASWEKQQNVTYDGTRVLGGRPMLVLRMTKKIRSDQLSYTLAYVDPATYEVSQMEWHYANGGTIVMTQTFRLEGPFRVLASQRATISIPHFRGIADSSYGRYETNGALSDSLFAKKL